MDKDPREIYLFCKQLIEKRDYLSFAETFSRLIQISNDEEYKKILKESLNRKFNNDCKDLTRTANNLRNFDSDEINSLYENFKLIKAANECCKQYMTEEQFNSENVSSLIDKELGEIVKNNFLAHIGNKTNEFSMDENLKNTLNFIIGYNFTDEISDRILCILKELEIDDEQFHKNITQSILNKGLLSLKEYEDDIPPKDFNLLEIKINSLFKNEQCQRKNQTPNEIISDILKELKIKDKDDLHLKIISSVLDNGVDSLNEFKKLVSKNNLNALKERLKILSSVNFTNNTGNKEKVEETNHSLKEKIIIDILKESKIKDEDDLYKKIVDLIIKNEEKLRKHFSKDINEEKIDFVILSILKECKIDDEDGLHKKIIDEIIENDIESIEKFSDDLSKNQFNLLEKKLKTNHVLNEFKTSKLDFKTKILQSVLKYKLRNKINFNKFNSVEGYIKPVDEIIKEICQNSSAESVFSIMIYLIKREQSLKFFINEYNFCLEEKQKVSLNELIYNLLLNCEDDVRFKIFQLLHSTNPVPFVNYFMTGENSLELNFYSETYWLIEGLNNKKIISFSLDSKCKGKTRFINSVFCTHFEETLKDSPFFNGTIDLQIVKSFGSQENNYFIADSHGMMDMNILKSVVNLFDVFIIQIHEDTLKTNKNLIKQIEKELLQKKNKMVIILVRDSKLVKLRTKCTDQEENIKLYAENFEMKFEIMIKICSIPELKDKDMIIDYGRTFRDFIYQEINDNDASLLSKDNLNDKFLEILNKENKERIFEIKKVVDPIMTQLKNAINKDGISQNCLFSIYPFYFELNLKRYELSKLDSYSNSNQKYNDLKVESSKLKIQLDNLVKSFKQDSKICTVFDLFIKLLNSKDYVLMTNYLSKKLNQILQIELKERQKDKEELINTLRSKIESKNSIDKPLIETKLNDLNLIIDRKRISIEIIWREMILIFNFLKSSQLNRSDYLVIGDRFSDFIFKGQPFEILDGDNFIFNKYFLECIFKPKQNRIRVVSILGPQNSGKSTLLNFMFGCDFTVSDGRCTRGIYGSLIKSNSDDFDYYLILDTEGLQSIEKGDKEYDRKLTLFCFAVSNVLIINTKDQITDDVKTTLETCVDSLTKIDVVRVQKPSVFFVVNQKADPNRKTDQDAINKIISNFTSNGLISKLKLERNNFETLPSAFNSSILKFNNGKSLVRSFTTSTEFTDRVLQFTNNIIDQLNQINCDDAFSNIYKWIEFSNIIFETINMYPDLTLFKDIVEKTQENKLQDHLNEKIANKFSNQVRNGIFNELDKIQNNEDAEKHLKNKISKIKQELINDFEIYLKINSGSENIRNLKKDHLTSKINQIEDSWIKLLKIKKREKDLRRTINSGEGIFYERVIELLKSNSYFTKEEAIEWFEVLFEERSDEIKKNIKDTINRKDYYFNFIYSIYYSLEIFPLPNEIELKRKLNDLKSEFRSPITRSESKSKIQKNYNQAINELKVIDKDQFESFYNACCVSMLNTFESKWHLVFDQSKFLKKLEDISNSIDLNQELDNELAQSIILKLENLFEDYNKDLNFFNLTLTMEPKIYAHMFIFKKLVDLYSNKNIQKAQNELRTWEQKKTSLCKFFVSQFSPDQDKEYI